MRTFVATKNAAKLAELRAVFSGSLLELETYPAYVEVAEDATSYVGNAILKARCLSEQLRDDGVEAPVLADDSGLEVDVLGGRPGVLSARYAGEKTTWPQRRSVLLEEMQGVPAEQRGAFFTCMMALIVPAEELHMAVGVVEGRILEKERGAHGFGYDPLFFYPRLGRTFAELTEEEKNGVSHRRHAAEALLATLRSGV